MSARWNDGTYVQPVQLDYETTPTPRAVRLAGPAARVGDPVRVLMGGAEVEGRIIAVAYSILYVQLIRRPAKDKLF